ncbi:VOC family protein [Sphingomonas sp. G-3-2-10]|uniref:VOC family protein n=1 Tax=Sphingomonas sp. G-3-2-10 TaxID=2728838 RepID=UPI00146E93FD|nr:VOC family protein [Sphingomonas sp. G-3-2-10]NML04753.1 VOC family protein [Sphingomonas sp. G-3-2-10]
MVLGSATPVAFLYVMDRERALGFYRDTLGFAPRSADAHGDFIDLGGALVRMTAMPGYAPGPHPVLGWEVNDIVASVTGLRERGVECIIYEGMGQDALGIWTSPDGKNKVAFFPDSEGNVLSVAQTG